MQSRFHEKLSERIHGGHQSCQDYMMQYKETFKMIIDLKSTSETVNKNLYFVNSSMCTIELSNRFLKNQNSLKSDNTQSLFKRSNITKLTREGSQV